MWLWSWKFPSTLVPFFRIRIHICREYPTLETNFNMTTMYVQNFTSPLTAYNMSTNQQYLDISDIGGIIILIECFCGLTFNIATILIIVKSPKLKTAYNQLVLCLAIGDSTIGILIPVNILEYIFRKYSMDEEWYTICYMRLGVPFLAININIDTLTVIAIERAVCVLFPIKGKVYLTARNSRIIASIVWMRVFILGVVLYSCGLGTIKLHFCEFKSSYTEFFGVYYTIATIGGCGCIIVICYTTIAIVLIRRNQRLGGLARSGSNTSGNTSGGISTIERKTITISAISVALFFVIYLPTLLEVFNSREPNSTISTIALFTTFFINPLVYLIHPTYRKAYTNLFHFKGKLKLPHSHRWFQTQECVNLFS